MKILKYNFRLTFPRTLDHIFLSFCFRVYADIFTVSLSRSENNQPTLSGSKIIKTFIFHLEVYLKHTCLAIVLLKFSIKYNIIYENFPLDTIFSGHAIANFRQNVLSY